MSNLLKEWQDAKSATAKAKAWESLPNGPKYQNDTFTISPLHCNLPKLVRAGQQSCGGKNYWETEKEFNLAILEWLVSNWKHVYPQVIAIIEEKEKKALLACQSYVDDLQSLINSASKQ